MKRFDFILTKDKEYYLEQIDLHIEKTKVSRVLDALLVSDSDGLYFEHQNDNIKGAYIENFPIIRSGRFFVTLKGRLENDSAGNLHFKGIILPSIIHLTAYLLLLISIIVFALDNIAFWVLFSIFFAFFAFVSVKMLIEAYRLLEKFFA